MPSSLWTATPRHHDHGGHFELPTSGGPPKVHWLADLMHEGFKVDVLAVQELNLPVVAADNFVEILGQRKIYVYFGGVDNNLYRCAILSTARGCFGGQS